MASLFTKFLMWLTNVSPKKDRILTQINPDIEENKVIKEQAKKIQSLEGQLSEIMAKRREKKVGNINLQEDMNLILELEKKQQEIEKNKYKGAYDLFKLAEKLKSNKKFASKFEIVDKDDNRVFDKFGTIVILKDGKLAIKGKSGEVWSEGYKISDIIFKPETLRNQVRRGRLLMPYDEGYNRILDLENIEMPELSYDEEDGKWNESEERFKKIKEMIIERDKHIQELREDKEHHEQTIADLRNQIKDIDLAKESWKSQAGNSQAELSVALNNAREISQRLGQLDRDLTMAQGQKELADQIKERYEEAMDELLNQMEDEKSKNMLRRAKDEIQRDIAWARQQIPKEIHTTIVDKEEEKPMIKPGERLKR